MRNKKLRKEIRLLERKIKILTEYKKFKTKQLTGVKPCCTIL